MSTLKSLISELTVKIKEQNQKKTSLDEYYSTKKEKIMNQIQTLQDEYDKTEELYVQEIKDISHNIHTLYTQKNYLDRINKYGITRFLKPITEDDKMVFDYLLHNRVFYDKIMKTNMNYGSF